MSSYSSTQHFGDFRSGAQMWLASLDTNSSWGTSFPLSVPAQPQKEVGVLDSKPVKVAQPILANEFVQISANQHWNSKSLNFVQYQEPMIKKISKFLTPATEVLLLPIEADASSEDESSTQNLYKTEPCRSFEETGVCRYGMKCQFAHGRVELRPVSRHPKYKTEVCKTFHTIGTCPYGKRCRFIHIDGPIAPQSSSVAPPKISESNAPAKPAFNFETLNGAGWSNSWNGAFSSATTVKINPVAKGLPLKNPADNL
jgi:hypothetical protein